MKKYFKISLALLLCLSLIIGCTACSEKTAEETTTTEEEQQEEVNVTVVQTGDARTTYPDAHIIELSTDSAVLDGTAVEEFDYTWNCDPSTVHEDVKNCPAEYYTGTEPETDAAAYIAHDIIYYPELDESGFTKVNYDGETEYAYYYTAEEYKDFIFATLPVRGTSLPTQMMHSAEEAYSNPVLHITEAGTYILEGTWNGQILINLGDTDDVFADENAKVTLVLNGCEVTCTVAPSLIFQSVYECDNTWEEQESWSADVDTTSAGAVVVLADDSVNNFTGANVFRMLKTKYKDEEPTNGSVQTQKKAHKTDGAFYSCMTMNIDGESKDNGVLNVVSSTFEGLDTELHLCFNGGNVTVTSQDDGINVNEDYVSVVMIKGGTVTLNPAQGSEGDGIDSNGYIAMYGGTLSVNGVRVPDSALDSECGFYYYGGTVIEDGETQDYTAGEVYSESMGGGMGGFGGGGFDIDSMFEDFDLAEFKKSVSELPDDATISDVLELLGVDLDNMGGGMGGGMSVPDMPQGGSFDPSTMSGGAMSAPEMPQGGSFDPSTMSGGAMSAPEMPQGGNFDPNSTSGGSMTTPAQMPQGGNAPAAK